MQISTIIKRKKFLAAALTVLALADAFFVWQAVSFSQKYPFDRVIVGSVFCSSFLSVGKSGVIKGRVEAVDRDMRTGNPKEFINSGAEIQRYIITDSNGISRELTFQKKFNYEAFSFIFLLLTIASVHLIWALVVANISLVYRYSNYYSMFSAAFAGVFFSYAFVPVTDSALFACAFFSSVLASVIVWITSEIAELKKRKTRMVLSVSAFLVPFVSSVLFFLHGSFGKALLISVIAPAFMFFIMIMNYVAEYTRRRKISVKCHPAVLVAVAGVILPLAYMAFSIEFDMPFSVYIAAVMTLCVPLFVGNNLILGSYGYSIVVRRSYLLRIVIDFASAVAVSFIGFYIMEFNTKKVSTAGVICAAFISLMVILYMRMVAARSVSDFVSTGKSDYLQSLRSIAVLSAESSELNYKLARIYIEIFKTLSINQMKLFVKSDKVRFGRSIVSSYVEPFNSHPSLVKFFAEHRGILSRDSIFTSARFLEIVAGLHEGDKFSLLMPFSSKNNISGALLAGQKRDGRVYDEDDISYLNSAAFMITQMIENDIMLTDYIQRISYEEELDNASFMQMRFFPKDTPVDAGFDLAYYTRPYVKLMGDYFDYIRIDASRTAVIIADVTGHGMPAAMIVTVTSMIFHSLIKMGTPLEKIFFELNDFLTSRYSGIELITLFAGIFDKRSRTLSFINAGHCQPVVFSKNVKGYRKIEESVYMLGVDPNAQFHVNTTGFEKGDYIILYTDGLTEIAEGAAGEDFGERIFDNIGRDMLKSTEIVLDSIVGQVVKVRPEKIKDDITVAVIKVE